MKKKTFLSTTSIRFLIDTTSDGPPVLSNANFLIPHVHPWKSKKNEVAILFFGRCENLPEMDSWKVAGY
jgi:hypothetical protein